MSQSTALLRIACLLTAVFTALRASFPSILGTMELRKGLNDRLAERLGRLFLFWLGCLVLSYDLRACTASIRSADLMIATFPCLQDGTSSITEITILLVPFKLLSSRRVWSEIPISNSNPNEPSSNKSDRSRTGLSGDNHVPRHERYF